MHLLGRTSCKGSFPEFKGGYSQVSLIRSLICPFVHARIPSLILSFAGNITTFLVYISPIGTFSKIVKNGSTEEFESLPYICMLLNAALWTHYGIIKPNGLLVATINGLGIFIETIFISLFLIFAPPKIKVKTVALALILDVGLVVSAILIARYDFQGEGRINAIGFSCACFTIISCGSPLAVMRRVVTTKSVEYMPFLLSFFVCINGMIWTLYAILVGDYFIGVPNGTGFVLGASQLVLYSIYRKAKASNNANGVLEQLIPS